jgi:hypothetical protein
VDKFEVGQKIRVLPLEELLRIGTVYNGIIAPPTGCDITFWFGAMVENCCNTVHVIEKDMIKKGSKGLIATIFGVWLISPWMCELVKDERSEEEPVSPEYLELKNVIFG